MTIEEMKERKRELGYTNKQVAELSGVPLGTVQKIFAGGTVAPRYETVRALERLLAYANYKPGIELTEKNKEIVCEAEAAYNYTYEEKENKSVPDFGIPVKEDGEYTIEDFLAIPDNIRAELIDGKLYMMSSPTTVHQCLSAGIFTQIYNYILINKGLCVPFYSPMDVQIDSDDKTMLEPDIFVVCDRDKIDKKRIKGAPDLIIEILSQNNWQHDMVVKFKKYKSSGVKEYWIVVPDQKSVMVYTFDKYDECKMYSFNDKVPVGIWEGKCVIDFLKITENIRFILE